jgi:hypothetical protein
MTRANPQYTPAAEMAQGPQMHQNHRHLPFVGVQS